MSKQVLRAIAQLATADYLARGKVITKCPAGHRSGGHACASSRQRSMPLAAILGIIRA